MRYLLIFLLAFGLFYAVRHNHGSFLGMGGVRGEGPTVTTERTVDAFQKIEGHVSMDIELYPSTQNRVEIVAQQNIADQIETTVRNGTLILNTKGTGISYSGKATIKVYTASPLMGLLQTASSNVHGIGTFRSEALTIVVQGSGNLLFDEVQTKQAEVQVSGSGNVEIASGTAEMLVVSLSGSGDLTLEPLQTQRAEVSISGSGNVRCHASETLKASISGSGDITYRGRPQVDSSISGSGNISGEGRTSSETEAVEDGEAK